MARTAATHSFFTFCAVAAAAAVSVSAASGARSSSPLRLQSVERAVASASKTSAPCADDACGDPLFVTPLLDAGKAAEAVDAARVGALPFAPGVTQPESFAGFFTVDKALGSNTFFWYVPATKPKAAAADAPVLLWLQGGPGGSSLFGLFDELGALQTDGDTITLRDASWGKEFDNIFLDNPVGTGFSFTSEDAGYAVKQDDYGATLLEAMHQFYRLFPEKLSAPFYITGESYAGHYIPVLGAHVLAANARGELPRIPLAGLAIGDGWCDPEVMVQQYAPMMRAFELADVSQAEIIKAYANRAVAAIRDGDFLKAFREWDALINGDQTGGVPPFFVNITGFSDYFNILAPEYPHQGAYGKLLASASVRRALHVGDLEYHGSDTVEKHLLHDVMTSVKPLFPGILASVPVLVYSGQLDAIVGAPLTDAFLRSLVWPGQAEYLAAERVIWRHEGTSVTGYVKSARNLTFAVVRNAGHLVPADQPEWALDMITRFVHSEAPFARADARHAKAAPRRLKR